MATILEFPQSQRLERPARRGSNALAEIVFFPGVRYERWNAEKPAIPKKRTVRRDKIELEG